MFFVRFTLMCISRAGPARAGPGPPVLTLTYFIYYPSPYYLSDGISYYGLDALLSFYGATSIELLRPHLRFVRGLLACLDGLFLFSYRSSAAYQRLSS